MEQFSVNLKDVITNSKYSVSEVASKLKINRSTLWSWTEGQVPRSLVTITKLCTFFDITVDELFYGKFDEFRRGPKPKTVITVIIKSTHEKPKELVDSLFSFPQGERKS